MKNLSQNDMTFHINDLPVDFSAVPDPPAELGGAPMVIVAGLMAGIQWGHLRTLPGTHGFPVW